MAVSQITAPSRRSCPTAGRSVSIATTRLPSGENAGLVAWMRSLSKSDAAASCGKVPQADPGLRVFDGNRSAIGEKREFPERPSFAAKLNHVVPRPRREVAPGEVVVVVALGTDSPLAEDILGLLDLLEIKCLACLAEEKHADGARQEGGCARRERVAA